MDRPGKNHRNDDLTVAVTGGTGFVGSALIRRLIRANIRVKALARPASAAKCFHLPGLVWIPGELSDARSRRNLVQGVDAVIYCAGSVRGQRAADFAAANVDGVDRMMRTLCETSEPFRFLLISSLAARKPELSAYAASKRLGEDLVRQKAADGNLEWTILRPPAVYGPGDREVLPLLQWLRRGILFVPGNREGRISLIFITDLAQAILDWLWCGSGGGHCYELHDGKADGYSWEDIRRIGEDLYRRPIHRINIPVGVVKGVAQLNAAAARLTGYRPMLTPGKVKELGHPDWVCDNTQFSSISGWQPRIDLYQGLRRTLDQRIR
jgi:nucleoside-diphosphate-sugar epimerase